MAVEKRTENITRRFLEKCSYTKGFIESSDFIVDEQTSENTRILLSLKWASKTLGKKWTGKPEFLIQKRWDERFLIVIECKRDTKFHESSNRDKERDYAVDGVLHYARALSREYSVIAIAVSGVTDSDILIDTFFHPKWVDSYTVLTDKDNTPVKEILPWDTYIAHAKRDKTLIRTRYEDLMKFSRELHNYMRDYCKITETQKPLLVSGVLLALMDKWGFADTWRWLDQVHALPWQLYDAIRRVIEDAELGVNKTKKKEAINNIFEFVRYHPELCRLSSKENETPLFHVVRELVTHVQPFVEDHFDFDIIGRFYGEFVRYTGGDKKWLGIVLTPKHITELFADLAKLKVTDTVIDTCTGTASFLIAAMYNMMSQATTEKEKMRIRQDALIGIEQNPEMFALAVANMILRWDGKTNLYQWSCFDEDVLVKVQGKADVGFINPPYSQKWDGLHEWDFIITMLDSLKEKWTGIVIVPMSMAIAEHPLRAKVLKSHRLEAVMSMPDDLFYPVGVVSCIMMFTAHVPHESDRHHESWFGYWKDDGFRKDRVEGRIAKSHDEWEKKKDEWIRAFTNRKEIPGFSVNKKVWATDEWCAEAYLETNYDTMSDQDFENALKKYTLFNISQS
jgi:type I restriction enzyme M protein